MLRAPRLARAVAVLMAAVMVMVTGPLDVARAALVPTGQVVAGAAVAAERERVAAFLARGDVRGQMMALGVDPAEAEARLASLSDGEIQIIAGQLDRLPAGQSAIGALIGAALFVFIVLLITDLLGLTDVFPFVRR